MITKKMEPRNFRTPPSQCKDTKKHQYIKSLAVKELERLADNAAKAKYPAVPYLVPRKFRDDTANGLTKCVISFLRLMGHQAERINSTGRIINKCKSYTDITGRRRTIGNYVWVYGTGTKGTADISATIAGRSVKIEVKIGHDRMSDAQCRYQESIERAGGLYVVTRSFEEFRDWYNETFSHE